MKTYVLNFRRRTYMNTPCLETPRRILRRFTESDIDALFSLLSDEEVNTFLPCFPLRTRDEAVQFFEERFAGNHQKPSGYNYAVCLKTDGIPYITATHDVKNPRSGGVMRQLGMKYQYSYEELVPPKNVLITFRMYQLNLDGNQERVYRKYWDESEVHFVEKLAEK